MVKRMRGYVNNYFFSTHDDKMRNRYIAKAGFGPFKQDDQSLKDPLVYYITIPMYCDGIYKQHSITYDEFQEYKEICIQQSSYFTQHISAYRAIY